MPDLPAIGSFNTWRFNIYGIYHVGRFAIFPSPETIPHAGAVD
jgi:hypothetical protein